MPVVAVREREISYEIRRSRRARRLRVVVRPGQVDAVAPWRTRRATIDSFVVANREWILERVERL